MEIDAKVECPFLYMDIIGEIFKFLS